MSRCDTPAEIRARNSDTCDPCWHEYESAGELFKWGECRKCEWGHLKKNMIEKLHGHLCFTCANQYEQELLAKLAEPEAKACAV